MLLMSSSVCDISLSTAPTQSQGAALRTNENGLSDTGTTEESDLSTTSVGSKEIDDLDTSLEYLGGGRLLDKLRRLGVDGHLCLCVDRTTLIDGLSDDVDDSSQAFWADVDHDWVASVDDLGSSNETLGTWWRRADLSFDEEMAARERIAYRP